MEKIDFFVWMEGIPDDFVDGETCDVDGEESSKNG